MELWQALGDLTAGVAVGALAIYFSNQLTIKYLDERKEWLQSLALERKEWNDSLEKLTDRYDARMVVAIEAIQAIKDQMHALRGDLQKALLGLENRLIQMDNRGRGGSDD